MALDVLASLPVIQGNPHYLAVNRTEAFNSWSQRKIEIDKLLPEDMPDWCFHDLRRTARSLMSRARVQPHIAELVLGHRQKGIIAVYDWYQYEAELAGIGVALDLNQLDSQPGRQRGADAGLETVIKTGIPSLTRAATRRK